MLPPLLCVSMLTLQKRGFEYMHRVATSCEALASHLVRAAQFNVGRAYYRGSGVRLSVSEAERSLVHFNTRAAQCVVANSFAVQI